MEKLSRASALIELRRVVVEEEQQVAGGGLKHPEDLTRAFLKRGEQLREKLLTARKVGNGIDSLRVEDFAAPRGEE